MDASARVACCLICTLADAMKVCPLCQFREGLTVKATAAIEPVTRESTEFLQTNEQET